MAFLLSVQVYSYSKELTLSQVYLFVFLLLVNVRSIHIWTCFLALLFYRVDHHSDSPVYTCYEHLDLRCRVKCPYIAGRAVCRYLDYLNEQERSLVEMKQHRASDVRGHGISTSATDFTIICRGISASNIMLIINRLKQYLFVTVIIFQFN